ncbi:MAG TPA: GDSL-type esterase/lipase family protein [Bacteroidia bacterium]|nr:GDSL-type esterase/lipase family protein [Bacteroidia bacterium]
MRNLKTIKQFVTGLGLLFIQLPLHLFAQEMAPGYSFMKPEFNHLYYGKDSSAFIKLFEKMKGLRDSLNTRVGVVHFGGSHVQAGVWSSTFVDDLQSEFGTSGGGYFVFPYKLAKTNGQAFATSFSNGHWKRYRAVGKDFCLPLGLCALSVSTHDSSCYFGTKLTEKARSKQFNEVKVYHNFNPNYICKPDTSSGVKYVQKDFRNSGYSLFTFEHPVDSLNFYLMRLDSMGGDFILFGFSLDNTLQRGFYLAGLGANGAASNSFLRCFDLSSQFASLNADLVILSLGVNDTQAKDFGKDEFIENYDSLIQVIKSVNPETAIILTTTSDNFIKRKRSNKKSITAREAMFELMEKHNLAVWDLFSVMGGYRSILKWQQAGLANKDRIHFTTKGYILLGNLMFEAFIKSYHNNQIPLK